MERFQSRRSLGKGLRRSRSARNLFRRSRRAHWQTKQPRSFLSLPRPHCSSHAHQPRCQMAGQKRTRRIRRLRHGSGPRSRARGHCPQEARPLRKHPHSFLIRPRSRFLRRQHPQGHSRTDPPPRRKGSPLQRPSSRLQILRIRRRTTRATHRSLARND